jgi:hypothetical protein
VSKDERALTEIINDITLQQHYGRYNSPEIKQEAKELQGFLELNLSIWVDNLDAEKHKLIERTLNEQPK